MLHLRNATRKTEIHHIDDDPSNNALDNLAVVCKDHHSEAHTTQAFARNLTPEIIRKYNESWRAVVRARLSPGGDQDLRLEYQQQVPIVSESDLAEGVAKLAVLHQTSGENTLTSRVITFPEKALDKVRTK